MLLGINVTNCLVQQPCFIIKSVSLKIRIQVIGSDCCVVQVVLDLLTATLLVGLTSVVCLGDIFSPF